MRNWAPQERVRGVRQALEVGSAQDWRGEIRRLWDLQSASRWTVARSSAAIAGRSCSG